MNIEDIIVSSGAADNDKVILSHRGITILSEILNCCDELGKLKCGNSHA